MQSVNKDQQQHHHHYKTWQYAHVHVVGLYIQHAVEQQLKLASKVLHKMYIDLQVNFMQDLTLTV